MRNRRIVPRAVLSAMLLCALLLLSGCWDDAEINGRAFVLGFGADKGPYAGSYDFTFQLAVPVSGDSESSGAIQYTNATVTESSVAAAIRLLEKDMGRQINFEQLNLIMIGEALSRENFTALTELFFRRASVRRQSCIAVCAGSAKDFFAVSSANNAVSSDAAVALQSYDDTGSADSMALNLHSLYKARSNTDEFYLLRISACRPDTLTGGEYHAAPDTAPDQNGNSILHISGAAAYGRQGSFRGELTAHELELMRLVANRQISGIISASDVQSGEVVDYQVKQSRCRTRCRLENGVPVFTVELRVNCVPIDGQGIGSPASVRQAEESVTRSLTGEMQRLAQRSRDSLGASVLGLQDKLRQQMPDWYEQHANDWEAIYRAASIEIQVNCTVIGGGITK